MTRSVAGGQWPVASLRVREATSLVEFAGGEVVADATGVG